MTTYRRKRLSADEYIEGVISGNRTILSQAITLIESKLPDDEALAEEVLETILPYTGQSIRVGITGVPGVGKSTFIERFGLHVITGAADVVRSPLGRAALAIGRGLPDLGGRGRGDG